MNAKIIKNIHKTVGKIALLIIIVFFSSSLYAELNGNDEVILRVKTGILYGIILLFFIMPATAITGKKLTGEHNSSVLTRKTKRMKLIAINAAVLIGLAFTLYYRAMHNLIDQTFVIIQLVEFVFGLYNAVLLILMIRDGRLLHTSD